MIRIREIRRADNAAVAGIIKKLINMHCKQQANIYKRV